MPKKNYSLYDPELAGQAFPKRFRELIERDGEKETIPKLKEALGVSSQAIKQYMIGTTYPKTENLIKIAQYFNCSLDYLIGLSDVQNVDADLQAVCDYIGLNETTVETIRKYAYPDGASNHCNFASLINVLVSNADTGFFERLRYYLFSDSISFLSPEDEYKAHRLVASGDTDTEEAKTLIEEFKEYSWTELVMLEDNETNISVEPIELDNSFKDAVFMKRLEESLRLIKENSTKRNKTKVL